MADRTSRTRKAPRRAAAPAAAKPARPRPAVRSRAAAPSSRPEASTSSPRPAATVVLVRPGLAGLEVLLTQRPGTMSFAADMHVFPGGAVDPGDGDARVVARSRRSPDEAASALGGDLSPEAASAAFAAGVRELFEEAGVLLATLNPSGPVAPASVVPVGDLEGWRRRLLAGEVGLAALAESRDLDLRTDLLAPLSRWVTPRFVERRFDVRFFAALLPDGVEPSFVGEEVVAHRWIAPRDALEAAAAGEIGLWVPTSATLRQLEHVRTFDEILLRLTPGQAAPIRLAEEAPGVVRAVLPGGGGVAGQSVNAWVVGRRSRVIVDPGDPSEAALDALLTLAERDGGEVAGIVLTHADPDHYAGAEALAGTCRVPTFAAPGVARQLLVEVTELADGDRVPVGDVELVAVATPGHRRDHLAFVAAAEGVAFCGDLVGDGPSRAILGPPDVPAWLASLDRLEGFAPPRLLPGHGDPPGEVHAAFEAQRARLRLSLAG